MKGKISLFLLLTFAIFGFIMIIYVHTDRALANVPNKIIRLHVVANSDSLEDQALKREVRDAVIKRMSPQFEKLKDVNEVKMVIDSNLSTIEDIAKSVIAHHNQAYGVKAELGAFDFPTKTYGDLTLPAGNYQALNIVIGSGKGQNWWCVMFPPLCFIDIAHGVVPQKTMGQLKESLSDEEYQILLSSKTGKDIPVKVRFKILEFAKSMNQKVAKAKVQSIDYRYQSPQY